MTRQEASELIGKNVFCWTGLRGCYIGRLLEVVPVRPWRGKVEICAVAEYPVQGMSANGAGFKRRKPAAFGAIWEFGNSSIKEHTGVVPDYQNSIIEALQNGIKGLTQTIESCRQLGRDYGLTQKWLRCLEEDIEMISRRKRKEENNE